ncbi:hypothetical protein MMC13_005751 [Lambiella insularis]|nr:hypothetical protein [Lambiella insularis]
MPTWRIYHNPSTFTAAQKAALAADITPLYTGAGLPGFFVHVHFIAVDEDAFFVSGKPQKNYVRINIEHIAIHQVKLEDDVKYSRQRMCRRFDQVLEPHIAARGDIHWEYNVYETPRDLWKVDGLAPPENKTEEMKAWAREGKALAWEKGELHGNV